MPVISSDHPHAEGMARPLDDYRAAMGAGAS